MLQIQNISKSYNKAIKKKRVLDNAMMALSEQRKAVLIGKSGCGKTTLLNILAGLLAADNGEIIYNDINLRHNSSSKERSDFRLNYIGIIPQRLCLINEYTVFNNISYPMQLRGEKKHQVLSDKVEDMAKRLQIADLLAEKASSLSAGQCQRVAIARALVTSPPILLADEPTSALDAETRDLVVTEFMKYPGTVLIVSHDSDVISSCSETFLLENGSISKV